MTHVTPDSSIALQPAPQLSRSNTRRRGLIGTTSVLALAMMLGDAGQAWGADCTSSARVGPVVSAATLTCRTDDSGSRNFDYGSDSSGSLALNAPVTLQSAVLTIGPMGQVDARSTIAYAVTANSNSGNGLTISAENAADVAVISSQIAGNGIYQVTGTNKAGNITFTSGTLTMSRPGVAFNIGGADEGTADTPATYKFNGATDMASTSSGQANTFFKLGTSRYAASITQTGTVMIPAPIGGDNTNIGYEIGDNQNTTVNLTLGNSANLHTHGGTAIKAGTAKVHALITENAAVTGAINLGTHADSRLTQNSKTEITGNITMGNNAQVTTIVGTGGVAGKIGGVNENTAGGNVVIGLNGKPATIVVDGTVTKVTSINTNALTVGAGSTLSQSDGTITATRIDVYGTLTQSGGTITGPSDALVPIRLQENGVFNYIGGTGIATVDGGVPKGGQNYAGTVNIGDGTATVKLSLDKTVNTVAATNGINTLNINKATVTFPDKTTIKANTITLANGSTVMRNFTLTSSSIPSSRTHSTCLGNYPYQGLVSLTGGSKLEGNLTLGDKDLLKLHGADAVSPNKVTGTITNGAVAIYSDALSNSASYTLDNKIDNSALMIQNMGTPMGTNGKNILPDGNGGVTLSLQADSAITNKQKLNNGVQSDQYSYPLLVCSSHVINSKDNSLFIRDTQTLGASLRFQSSSLVNNGRIGILSVHNSAIFEKSFFQNSVERAFKVKTNSGVGLRLISSTLENFGTLEVTGTESGINFQGQNPQVTNGWLSKDQYGVIDVKSGGISVVSLSNPVILNWGHMKINGETTIESGGKLTYIMGINQAGRSYAKSLTDNVANINEAGAITFSGGTPFLNSEQCVMQIDDASISTIKIDQNKTSASDVMYVVATSTKGVFTFPDSLEMAKPISGKYGREFKVFTINNGKTLVAVLPASQVSTVSNVANAIAHVDAKDAAEINNFLNNGNKTLADLLAELDKVAGTETGISIPSALVRALTDFLRMEGLKERVQSFLNFGAPEGSNGTATSAGSGDYISMGDTGLKAWAKVMASDEDQKRMGTYPGYNMKTYGFSAGVTSVLDQGKKLGFVVGYNESKDQEKIDSVTGLKIKSNVVGVYGHMSPQETWYLEGSILLGLNQNHGSRLDFSNKIYSKKYRSYSSIGDARWGYNIAKADSPWTIRPYLATLLGCTYTSKYTETGGNLPVTVDKNIQYNAQFGFGTNVSYALEVNENWRAVPEFTAQYLHEFNGRSRLINATWIGVPLGIPIPALGTDLVTLGASMKLKSKNGTHLTFDYSATLKNKYVGHTGFVKVSYGF